MARAGARAGRSATPAAPTRQRVVDAAVETLKREGYTGTSAREVARTGGFSQGVVFYHFNGMTELLLAALQQTSHIRMTRYQQLLDDAATLPELVAGASTIFHEDLEAGHVKVLAELIAATSAIPDLGPEITACLEPWIELTTAAVERMTAMTALAEVLPPRPLAVGIVALYLGLELLTNLDGDRAPAEQLFGTAQLVATVAEQILASLPATEEAAGAARPATTRTQT